jgi:L-aspartate oxidase
LSADPAAASFVGRSGLTIRYDDALDDTELQSTAFTGEQSALQVRQRVQQLMWQYVSLRRDAEGLLLARQQICAMRALVSRMSGQDSQSFETINMLQVAELVIVAALERRESRGSHWRSDYQAFDVQMASQHFVFKSLRTESYGSVLAEKESSSYV